MAYSLRLPDALDAAARAKAEYLGISLNALLCVALDAYLCTPGDGRPGELCKATGDARGEPTPSKTSREPTGAGEPVKLSRAEKQALYEAKKRERKALSGH